MCVRGAQGNRYLVLSLTFLCYTCYHMSRKPPSIVKSVLHGDSAANTTLEDYHFGERTLTD